MKSRSLILNISKTNVMIYGADQASAPSGVWPCAVRKRDVGGNFILCLVCGNLVHKKCNAVIGSLSNVIYFTCSVCNGS